MMNKYRCYRRLERKLNVSALFNTPKRGIYFKIKSETQHNDQLEKTNAELQSVTQTYQRALARIVIHLSPPVMAAATNQRVGAATMVVDDTSAVPRGGPTYTGRVVDGKRDGRGTAKWPDGDTYDGVWLNGAITGRGVYKWPDGSTYEGECLNNKSNGWGVKHRADGGWFEGLWRDDHWKRGTWHDSNGVDVWDGVGCAKEDDNQGGGHSENSGLV
ncbi:hypothetical protein Pelo_19301 [Pelomyxa schiedti]|nr:hypothetical protein Pelo_19301 [Pelomyxa schiedti]